MADIWIEGIVADGRPCVQLLNERGMIAQLSLAEARTIAMGILVTCSRAESDAMVMQFFEAEQVPHGVAMAALQGFRDFRALLDDEKVEINAH